MVCLALACSSLYSEGMGGILQYPKIGKSFTQNTQWNAGQKEEGEPACYFVKVNFWRITNCLQSKLISEFTMLPCIATLWYLWKWSHRWQIEACTHTVGQIFFEWMDWKGKTDGSGKFKYELKCSESKSFKPFLTIHIHRCWRKGCILTDKLSL